MEQVVNISVDVIKTLQKGPTIDESIFCKCCFEMDDTNKVHLWGPYKEKMCKALGFTYPTINKVMKRLTEGGFVTKVSKGVYHIDKKFAKRFWVPKY
jgi:transcription initiation factor IIE alpha subunit